jgi:hypothetical protein
MRTKHNRKKTYNILILNLNYNYQIALITVFVTKPINFYRFINKIHISLGVTAIENMMIIIYHRRHEK